MRETTGSVYDGARVRWTSTKENAVMFYDGTRKRWMTTKENALYVYDAARKRWTQVYEGTTNGYSSARTFWAKRNELGPELRSRAEKGWTVTKEWLNDAWQHPGDFAAKSYEATKTGFAVTTKYTMATINSAAKGTRATIAFTGGFISQTRQRSSDAMVVVKDTWSVTHSRVAGFYGFVNEWTSYVVDEAKNTYVYRRMVSFLKYVF